MKATAEWYLTSGASFGLGTGRAGLAHLKYYTAEFFEWGDGPPLVLVPGLAGGCGLLGPLARLLANDYRVISFQLRGEDDCFALRRRFGLDDLVEDLAEFLQWRGLERPAVVGVSFGGILALEYASRYPSLVRALAVQGVGARFEPSLLKQVAGMILTRYPLPTDSPFVNQFFQLLFGKRQKPGPMFEFVTRQCWQTDQSIMAHRFQLVESFDITQRLNHIHVPALLLAGDRDLLTSQQSLDRLWKGLADSKRVLIPDAGHLAFVTHSYRVAEEITRFLAQLDGEER